MSPIFIVGLFKDMCDLLNNVGLVLTLVVVILFIRYAIKDITGV